MPNLVEQNITLMPSGITTNTGAYVHQHRLADCGDHQLEFHQSAGLYFPDAIGHAGEWIIPTNDNQTLTFDDYQMSQDAFVAIGSTSTAVWARKGRTGRMLLGKTISLVESNRKGTFSPWPIHGWIRWKVWTLRRRLWQQTTC